MGIDRDSCSPRNYGNGGTDPTDTLFSLGSQDIPARTTIHQYSVMQSQELIVCFSHIDLSVQ